LSLAIDGLGNIFAPSLGGNSVGELVGLAKPVLTPVQARLKQGRDLCLP